jgi:serine/threonine-protein kinase
MGDVFRARDVKLDRIVALKRITSFSPEAEQRLLREAQHQAKIDHPYVCKVYGFGQLEDRPYIALQYAEGGTLAERYKELSLSERIRLLQRVALAIDAAHQIGLIHRDLKPSNILLEKEPSGGIVPLVADFGISRALDAQATHTGTVVGTPAYMSPEQALGKRDVDHRTDVYALGATLYELVCGRRMFGESEAGGAGPTSLMMRIVEFEPRPPRSIDKGIARDLEAIIQHCIEKEPARRYQSARALADDLDRYLAGNAVVARPQTIFYRAAKWARRRRGYVALGLLALVGIAIFATIAVRARLSAAARSRAAQWLGRELERIETRLRIAYLLPPHDVEQDRKKLRGQLGAVRVAVDVQAGERDASAQGRVAVARTLLLLDDPDDASRELEQAHALGEDSAEYHVALGETLLARYRREAVELPGMARETRKRRAEELRVQFLAPAAAALAKGEEWISPLLAAELAVAERRGDAALASARAALEKDPWLAEAHVLAGQVLLDRAMEQVQSNKCAEAAATVDEATREMDAAAAIARSLPDAAAGACAAAAMAAHAVGCTHADPSDAVARAVAVCEAGRKVDSRREELWKLAATSAQQAAAVMIGDAHDPSVMIAHMKTIAAEGHQAFPDAVWPLAMGASADSLRGDMLAYSGKDPTEALDSAIVGYRAYIQRAPSMSAWNNLAQVYKTRAAFLGEQGQDPRPALAEGIAAAEQAILLGPDLYYPYYTMGNLCSDRGSFELERGEDPSASYARAQQAYKKLLEMRPGDAEGYNGIAVASWGIGVYQAGAGQDPTASYQEAISAYRRSLELDPHGFLPPYNLAEALRYLASYRIVKGGDAATLLEEARGLLVKLLEARPPNLPDAQEELAAVELAFGRAAMAGKQDAEVAARTRAALEILRALPPNPRRIALHALGVAYIGGAGMAAEVAALRALAKANPGPEAEIAGAALDLAGGAGDAEAARQALNKAVARSVYLRDEVRPLVAR